jgi:hypothetical protein
MPETTIREAFGRTFVIAPAKPVGVGDTWTETDKFGLGPLGNIEVKSAMKLEGVKGDLATVGMKGDVAFKPGDGGDIGLPVKFSKIDLKADNLTATHTFDMKTGRVAETKTDMELSGSITIEAAGMKVDATVKQKMKAVGVITEKNPIVD